jgi:CO/xanthine dehydrogenase Mo-binding subunit
MLEQSEIFELNRKYLVGKVVCSTVAKAHIAAIEIPSDRRYPNITVVYATDLGSCNYVEVMDEKVPILAADEISYKGQPVLAVFGPESEDVDLFCQEVKISYKIEPEAEESGSEVFGEPFCWSHGKIEDYFVQGAKSVKSTFSVAAHESTLLGGQRIFAILEDGVMNLQLETQWPVNVRKSVANALGFPLDKVCVYAQPNEASYDQFIFSPTVLSCLAAVAAEKTNSPVQICAPLVSYQPGLNFKFESVVDHDEGCVAGKYSCTVDMGAFPIFTQEVFNNILAGLVPVYPMKALEIKVTIVKSPLAPANFFGDLGFAMSQAACENHFTQVALALGKQPGLWRLELLKSCTGTGPVMSEKARQSTGFENLSATLENVITDSWYARKSAANTQKTLSGIKVNPLVNYSKGIGIATGEGIMGFSQKFNVAMKYSLAVTLTEDNKVIVNTGIQAGKNTVLIWKQTIKQYLDVPEDDITFMDINDPKIIDIGPNVLSRKMGIVTSLLIQACSEIARKKEFSRLPITVTAVAEPDDSDIFYHCSCFGSVAVELHVDTVTLCPVIDNVWARFHMGHVYDMQKLINRARLSIFTVISEVFPNISWQFNIDLKVVEDDKFGQSSITSALRGLTISALIGALSQALGHNVNFLPIKETDILSILKKPEVKDEA